MAGKKKKPKKPRPDIVDTTMSLGDHLEELRARILLALLGLIVGTIAGLIFGKQIMGFVLAPYNRIAPNTPLVVLGIPDAFVAYFKISMMAGIILMSPWIFYQLWAFVAAGLYRHERAYVYRSLPFSVFLFVAGAMFFLLAVAPLSLKFFIGFGQWLGVESNWTLEKYISFITVLMLVFGLAFQMPIAIYILNRTGLVSIESFKKSRRFVLLGTFIIAAVATPGPDVISQIALATPLYGLFEIGILISWLSARKRSRAAAIESDASKRAKGGGASAAAASAPPSPDAAASGASLSPAADGADEPASESYPEPVFGGEPQQAVGTDAGTEGETPAPVRGDGNATGPVDPDSDRLDADKPTDEQVEGNGRPAGADGEPAKPDEQVYSD